MADRSTKSAQTPDAEPEEGWPVWEVFRQERDGEPMRHAGNLRAPDAELARHYAREMYGRRQESIRIWAVPRDAIAVIDDADWLQPPLDRSFKKPGGYVMRDKLAAARQRAAGSQERATQGSLADITAGTEPGG
jgi:ring-1,2-phenylacetyl-CoA epoxidase subunit PaaB